LAVHLSYGHKSVSPTQHERQSRTAIGYAAQRLSIKANLRQIFFGSARPNEASTYHCRQRWGKASGKWADHFEAGNLTQSGLVLHILAFGTRSSVWPLKEG
jgi:hypothetical protein